MSNVSPLHAATTVLARRVTDCAALAANGPVLLSIAPHPFAPELLRAVVESADDAGEYLRSAIGPTLDGALSNLLATVGA